MRPFITYSFLILLLWTVTSCQEPDEEFSEVSKIAMRDVGNKLLLMAQDSVSLILPITKIKKNKYQLKFQENLVIEPDSLVSIVKNSFEKAQLPTEYRIEVIKCDDEEVAYSYEVKDDEENNIIPCSGRNLPYSCYNIQVRFLKKTNPVSINYLSIAAIAFIGFGFLYKRKRSKTTVDNEKVGSFSKIGNYEFHPEQHQLVFNDHETNLSKKECELLEILCENLNEIVKRDELTKRVWEDHGVFVGRSLDTYISKLRKKFNKDAAIKITNVHGVGYKLEVC